MTYDLKLGGKMSLMKSLFGPPDIEKLKSESNIKKLMEALGYRKDTSVARKASNALVEIGKQAVTPLVDVLKNKYYDDYIKELATQTLVNIGEPAVMALINIGSNPYSKSYAMKALIELGTGSIPTLIQHLKQYGKQSSLIPYYPHFAIEVLGKMGEPAAEELVEVLCFSGLTHSEADKAAEKALIMIGPPAVQSLIKILKEDELHIDGYTRIENVLMTIGVPDIEPLIEIMQEKNLRVDVYKRAVALLGKIGNSEAIIPLTEMLTVEDQSLRDVTADALYDLGWKPDSVELGAIYYVGLRNWAESKKYREKAIEPLLICLENLDLHTTDEIAQLLGNIGDMRAVERLEKKLFSIEARQRRLEKQTASYDDLAVYMADETGGKDWHEESKKNYDMNEEIKALKKCIAAITEAVEKIKKEGTS
jgi:HEAT repeat protein